MWTSLLSLILVGLSSHVHVALAQNDVCFVNSLNGPIRGELKTSALGKEVCAFFGIPYAKPPVGDLRFKRPIAIDNWTNVLNATVLPDMCSQNISFVRNSDNRAFPNKSEDCLYMNIWVPLSLFNSPTKSAAVMIWIHGGGFIGGSISEPLINNGIFSGENDVIIAFMQYRVGPLGSLYFGTDDAPGNMGLIDQSMGVKWVYDNIQGFGGDKEKITMFGESAGAFSVSYHSLSPLTRDYFKRGILLSGAATSPILSRSNEAATKFSYEVAEHVACYTQGEEKPVEEIIACMRTKDDIALSFSSYVPKFFPDFQAGFTVDGYFLMDTPQNLLKDPANSKIDFLLGSTSEEGSYLLKMTYPDIFDKNKYPNYTREETEAFMRRMFNNLPDYEQEAIITHYTHWENFNDTYANLQEMVQAAGDYSIVCPALDFAKTVASHGRKVYSYWFTHTKADSFLCGPWMGACHGSELEFVFGPQLANPETPDYEKNLSRKMMELFTNFAKTGIPSDNWLEYTPGDPVYLDINGTVISDITPNNIYGPRPIDCTLWNIELPRLRSYAEKEPEPCDNSAFSTVKNEVLLAFLTTLIVDSYL